MGKVNPTDKATCRAEQEALALAIDAEPLTFAEKAAKWKAAIGLCAVTFWRVLKRAGQK